MLLLLLWAAGRPIDIVVIGTRAPARSAVGFNERSEVPRATTAIVKTQEREKEHMIIVTTTQQFVVRRRIELRIGTGSKNKRKQHRPDRLLSPPPVLSRKEHLSLVCCKLVSLRSLWLCELVGWVKRDKGREGSYDVVKHDKVINTFGHFW